jgi:2-oxoisovalerate dehydrogenase E2 component (dihydrolipoyl transacylase)
LSHQVFLLPDVGEGLIEAEIIAWKIAVGDVVALNQPLVEVETAKAAVELPSPYAGVVVTLHGQVGDTMEVNKPLVTFEVAGTPELVSDEKSTAHDAPYVPEDPGREPVLIGYGVANEEAVVTRRSRRSARSLEAPPTVPVAESPRNAVRTTPPVRLLAKQYGIDLASVLGSGRDGLVTREDVERARVVPSGTAAAQRREPVRVSSPNQPSRFVGREIDSWLSGQREERFPVKGVLKSMAEAMLQSTTQQPQAAVWTRVDASKTMELVSGLKAHPNFANLRLSPLTIVALAVCDAARHYPGINSSFDAANNEVVVRRYVNLGIAADTPRGLIVPNIKDADQLDVMGMASALSTLVETARNGTTTPSDMLATTLTITNVGPFGVDAAVAILPPGTGAILCVGQIVKAPWVVDDQVVVRQVAELSLTFDHRQIDGALASAVLAHIGKFLHDPATALLAQ